MGETGRAIGTRSAPVGRIQIERRITKNLTMSEPDFPAARLTTLNLDLQAADVIVRLPGPCTQVGRCQPFSIPRERPR